MTDPATPEPAPPAPAVPVNPPPRGRPPKAARKGFGCLLPFALGFLLLSLLANVVLSLIVVAQFNTNTDEPASVNERFYLGEHGAADRVAVVRVEGMISDFTIGYPIKQLERASKDRRVKAVVLRIDSPGGTVTASEELYQNVLNVRDNTGRRWTGSGPKPVFVSMGGVAASGGYYIAMGGNPIAAERTTITGSIGVFAALPNVSGFLHDHKITVQLVKAGGMKGSGSFFHEMSPQERQTWQDTVDNAYDVFLSVIAAGRPGLTKERLRDEVVIERTLTKRDDKGNPIIEKGDPVTEKYTRVRADGGTFTAEEARKIGLIDKVEDLPATIRAAAAAAGLGSFQAVMYDRPPNVLDLLTGGHLGSRQTSPDLRGVSGSLTPRLWFLAPSADGAILAPAP